MALNTQPHERLRRLDRLAYEITTFKRMPDVVTFGEMIRDITTCLKLLLDLWPVLNEEETPMEQPAPISSNNERELENNAKGVLRRSMREWWGSHNRDRYEARRPYNTLQSALDILDQVYSDSPLPQDAFRSLLQVWRNNG